MDIDLGSVEVIDNKVEQRFEALLYGEHAFIEYRLDGDRMLLPYVEVPGPFEGRGLAAKLTKAALEDARARRLMVVPLCGYVVSYLKRHQEYLDLVAPEYQARVRRGG